MNSASIHLERIAPGRAPGGILVRICTIDRLLLERALTEPELAASAGSFDADATIAAIGGGAEEVRAYFYDGDSGECLLTVVAGR